MLKKIFAVMSIVIACVVVPISCSVCSVNADTTISLTAYDDTVPDIPAWTPVVPDMIEDYREDTLQIGEAQIYNDYQISRSCSSLFCDLVEFDDDRTDYFRLWYSSNYYFEEYDNIVGLNNISFLKMFDNDDVAYYDALNTFDIGFYKGTAGVNAVYQNFTVASARFTLYKPYDITNTNLVVNYIFRNSTTSQISNQYRFENVTFNDDGTYTTNYIIAKMALNYDVYNTSVYRSLCLYSPYLTKTSTIINSYYRNGYYDGSLYGYKVGFSDGYGQGYLNGYETGYEDGLDVTKDIEEPMLAIVNGANTLLDIQLFGAFSVRDMLGIVLALSFLFIGIHLFRG